MLAATGCLVYSSHVRMQLALISKVTFNWEPSGAVGCHPIGTASDMLSDASVVRPVRMNFQDVDYCSGGKDLAFASWDCFISLKSLQHRPSSPRKVKGVTSSKRISLTSPEETRAWMAAPIATTSCRINTFVWFFAKFFATASEQQASNNTAYSTTALNPQGVNQHLDNLFVGFRVNALPNLL